MLLATYLCWHLWHNFPSTNSVPVNLQLSMIRKEEKGGKNFRKIGFVDVDMAEYAGAGPSTQRYILQVKK